MRTLEELLYETAAHALAQQERHVADLRSRAGTLLAATALSASFLGATAVDRAGTSVPVVLATVALVGTIGLCLLVLTPGEMVFALDIEALDQDLPAEIGDRLVHVHLASWLHSTRTLNKALVDALDARFRRASLLLVAARIVDRGADGRLRNTMDDQPRTRIRLSDVKPLPDSALLREDGTRGDEPPRRYWWQLLQRRSDRSQRSSKRAKGTVTQR